MIRKFLAMLAAAVTILAASATVSAAQTTYYGGWYFDDNPGGYEVIILGDGNGWGYRLEGTERYCVETGAGYATMRRVMRESVYGGQWVQWWVDYACNDGYDRVCIYNGRETRCSTYWVYGWVEWWGNNNYR